MQRRVENEELEEEILRAKTAVRLVLSRPGGPRHSADISYVRMSSKACAEATWKIQPRPHILRVWKQETVDPEGGCGHSEVATRGRAR